MERDEAAEREIAADCRYFLGDRPCVWHKREGALCTCPHYEPLAQRLLMIKLDAMGDVLRTTALLRGLAAAHPRAALTWVTRAESAPLLRDNPYVDEVLVYGPEALVCLGAVPFDRVMNLDAGKISAGLATLARGKRKDGFVLGPQGHVAATNAAAREWLALGVFDDLKRRNTRTYQETMARILDLPGGAGDYVLCLNEEEREAARAHLARLGLDPSVAILGLNTGAGGRWPLKQWREDGFLELLSRLHDRFAGGLQFLLLGGPAEIERNARLVAQSPVRLFDAGGDNEVRRFAAIVGCCSVVVAGDTLAMHLALALGRRIVVLFGPTSAPEIELYGRGEKLLADLDCLSCYKSGCTRRPNCMDLITAQQVAAAVERQLALAQL